MGAVFWNMFLGPLPLCMAFSYVGFSDSRRVSVITENVICSGKGLHRATSAVATNCSNQIMLCVIEQCFGLLTAICIFKLSDHTYYTMGSLVYPQSRLVVQRSVIFLSLVLWAYILHGNRTEFSRSNQMITKLVNLLLTDRLGYNRGGMHYY
ncbi:hypothetical protein DFH29DRAFT_375129 [Suillus ampliporus]|nr:hypothetical protein DFH29DRAFT_375129 [Suillus ampliporus]